MSSRLRTCQHPYQELRCQACAGMLSSAQHARIQRPAASVLRCAAAAHAPCADAAGKAAQALLGVQLAADLRRGQETKAPLRYHLTAAVRQADDSPRHSNLHATTHCSLQVAAPTCHAVSRCPPPLPLLPPPTRLDSTCRRVFTTSIGWVAMEAVAEQSEEQTG